MNSELDHLIAPEIKNDAFYQAIRRIAAEEDIRHILEIGSSAGDGSTEAFVSGLSRRRTPATLYCMEISEPRFEALSRRYTDNRQVVCYRASSVPLEKFPEDADIETFYRSTPSALNQYPLKRVLGWLHQDKAYIRDKQVYQRGIEKIKKDHDISSFDLVLIDGSEFTGHAELDEVYGARVIMLDDINGFKNHGNYRRLDGDPDYERVEENRRLRNGYAIFRRKKAASGKGLPVHFFTIVLNGQPFISYHLDVFRQLDFPWHWHIVEGLAELKNDTAWSVSTGGRIDQSFHVHGLSKDGTSGYLDKIARQYKDQVTVYRKGRGRLWCGKLEMVNVPLVNIREECLLWQIDADEFWEPHKINKLRDLFLSRSSKSAAFVHCDYFVGPRKYITSMNTWATQPMDWLRVWRYDADMRWNAHEPPTLVDRYGKDVGRIDPFTRDETLSEGIDFQHYAYVMASQVLFKESYYGYKDALSQWQTLQRVKGRVRPAQYLRWAKPDAWADDWPADRPGLLLARFLQKPASPEPAGTYQSTSVAQGTEFESAVRRLIKAVRPRNVIETGTYRGRGTTTLLWQALKESGQAARLTTIEVNPANHLQAKDYFKSHHMDVEAVLGLSLPRQMLPTRDQIEKEFVENKSPDDSIYYDHEDHRRADLYYGETDYDVPDNRLHEALARCDFKPDLLLLDSAGHLGYLEFKFVLSHIRQGCHIILDDTRHCKHHRSLEQIRRDPRFEIIEESHEKFGFVIARFEPIESLLYLRTDAIGDNILASSMLPYLARHFHPAKIHIVCQRHIAPLYAHCPHADTVQVIPSGQKWKDVNEYRAFIAKTSELKPDLLINPVYSVHSSSDLFGLDFIPKRVAMRPSELLEYNHVIATPSQNMTEPERNGFFLRGLGVEMDESLHPQMWLSEKDLRFAEDCFQRNGLAAEKTIVLFTGSLVKMKQYPRWAEVLASLCGRDGFDIVALGGDSDKTYHEHLRQGLSIKYLNLCGQTTLLQAAALIKYARLALGVDTSLGHMACAVETDNVILLGGGHFGRFFPYSSKTSVVCMPMNCYGCQWTCTQGRAHCIQGIAPETVVRAVRAALERPSPKPRIFAQEECLNPPAVQGKSLMDLSVWTDRDRVDIATVDGGVRTQPARIRENPGITGGPSQDQVPGAHRQAEYCMDRKKHPVTTTRLVKLTHWNCGEDWIPGASGRIPHTKISVILPTKDNAAGLKETLASLPDAMRDIPYEIIVYADRESEAIKRLLKGYPVTEVICDNQVFKANEPFSWSKLMNHGFARASGQWIMYGSDDIVFYPGCFQMAVSLLQSRPDGDIGGVAFLHRNTVETHGGFFTDFGYDTLNGDKPFINFGLISAEAYARTDGFDEDFKFFCADTDICIQLLNRGYRIVPSFGSLVDHNNILEKNKKRQRIAFFERDTAHFYAKWHHTTFFEGRSPLEKVRFFMDCNESRRFIETLRSGPTLPLDVPNTDRSMNIVIDGAIFQCEPNWMPELCTALRSLFLELERRLPDAQITLLQREGFEIPIEGVRRITVPPMRQGNSDDMDADDWMLHQACRELNADFFISTYYTRAPGVHNIVLVHDGVSHADKSAPPSPEYILRRRAFETGDTFVYGSQGTRDHLQGDFPRMALVPMKAAPDKLPTTTAAHGERPQAVSAVDRYAALIHWKETAGQVHDLVRGALAQPSILLTAIVSTFNAFRFISGCLDDLVGQSLVNRLEIIVVDSASEQDEVAVVRDFQRRHANIKYIRTARRESVYQSWNRGIRFALGKYITNANTDDRHRRDAFEQMVGILEKNEKIALVYADVIKTRTEGETFNQCTPTGIFRWPDWDRQALLTKGCFIGPQPVWRRNIHAIYGYFDERYEISSDFEFWLRISQTKDFYHIPRPLGLYLERPDSIEHANNWKKRQEDEQIIKCYRHAAEKNTLIGVPHVNGKAVDPAESMIARGRTMTGSCAAASLIPVQTEPTQGGYQMNSPETIFSAIKLLIDNQQNEAAYWAMGKLLADVPGNARLHNEMATMAYELGDMQNALQHFNQAADIAPRDARYRKNLADFYYVVQKDAQVALAQYAQVLQIDPHHAEALIMAGHVSVSLHRYTEAREYYERAQRLQPNNAEVREILQKMNHPPGDGKFNPASADDLYVAAQARVREGDRATAILLLEQLLDQDGTHALSHNDLGVLCYEDGKMETALAHYRRAVDLMPENEVFHKNLGDFYWAEMRDPQQALQAYVQALKLDPQDVDVLLNCGQICMALGRSADARDFFDTALQIEPWNTDARQLLERLMHPTGADSDGYAPGPHAPLQAGAPSTDGQNAIGELERLLAASPDSAEMQNDLGVRCYEAGDKNKALQCYETAVRLDPDAHIYCKNLADFYLIEQGRAEDAMKLYLKVLETAPEDIEALVAVGMVCATLGKEKDAHYFYRRALEIDPCNETANNALTDLKRRGNVAEAEACNTAAVG